MNRQKNWTDLSEKELAFIKINRNKMKVEDLAKELGWNHSTLQQKILNHFGYSEGYKRNCKFCGAEFQSRYSQIYCSEKCQRDADRLRAIKNKHKPEKRFMSYKSSAKSRKISFELDFEDFMEFWQEPCIYCGDSINHIGIDRIDNTIGYTIDNCVPCCKTCNLMKRDMSVEDFYKHIEKICGRQI